VWTKPGATALTRMPRGASSRAATWVGIESPALAEQYALMPAAGWRPLSEPIDTSDLRGGGRLTVEAWIGKRLRLFAAYDASSAIEHSPEITGYKSLRLTMTGVY